MKVTFERVLRLERLDDPAMTLCSVGGFELLLARVNDEVFAVDDLCTHEDASLSSGVLEETRVRCPLHGSWFCLRTGVPEEEPAAEPVRCYPTRVREGWIEVDLAHEESGT